MAGQRDDSRPESQHRLAVLIDASRSMSVRDQRKRPEDVREAAVALGFLNSPQVLELLDSQREQGRRARRRNEVPTVSLVGYTNAGKSTLFNRLTEAGVYAQDQLFATLDPTVRRVELPDGSDIVLADTVGFEADFA